MKRTHGFTMVELMVTVGIMGIVIAGLLGTFTTQQRTYVVVDQVVETQQNVRTVAELLDRDLRQAGYLVPRAASVCAWDQTNGPDTLFVSDSDVLRTVDALTPELAAGGLGAPVAGVGVGWTNGAVVNLTRNWVDMAVDGADFRQGGGVILVDRNDPNGRVACGIITNFAGGTTLTVNWNGTGIGPMGTNPDVVAVPAHVYQLVATAGGGFQLQRDGLLLAEDVEDLQLALFFDDDLDRVVDAGEMHGDGVAPNATYAPGAANGRNLREVRFTFVGVTRDPDPRQEYVQGLPQAAENRVLGAPPADGFRRRVHTATVRIRNLGTT